MNISTGFAKAITLISDCIPAIPAKIFSRLKLFLTTLLFIGGFILGVHLVGHALDAENENHDVMVITHQQATQADNDHE